VNNSKNQQNGFKQLGKLQKNESLENNVKRVLNEQYDGNKNDFMKAFVAQIGKQ